MNVNDILGVVLSTAKQSAENVRRPSETPSDMINKMGGGAALAGILSMVLGRNGGAGLTKLGSLAVLGNLAYQAYQNYQKSQMSASQLTESDFDSMPSTATNEKSMVILRTMIAAALSDGDLDEQEQALIERESGDNPELQQWLINEIQRPISVEEIAQIVGRDMALASQVYLAARVVCKELSRKEIVFLSQLAEALHLDDALVEQLEKQAGF
ncbi:tellurite resistance TerB family protein [Pasteurellaceae bacterium 22721_9_1]